MFRLKEYLRFAITREEVDIVEKQSFETAASFPVIKI